MGVLNNIIQMAIKIHSSKDSEDIKKVVQAIKVYSFDLIRCLFDCLVALYYLKNNLPAGKIGILGVITSIMGIMQSIEKMWSIKQLYLFSSYSWWCHINHILDILDPSFIRRQKRLK